MDAGLILLPASILCLLMIVTHTYLGLHVLARGIIFVDLALAQVAALGMSIAFLLGEEAHGFTAQLYAFAATLFVAFAFAHLRFIPSKTAREVAIGCVYVVSTALSIMILSRSSQGMEALKSMFNGNILWTSWDEIIVVALVYAVLALLHGIYRKRFHALSFSEGDEDKSSFLWEFLFFASFAVVITLAVNLAGILLVFALLIIPAFSASIISATFVIRLGLGWLLAIVGVLIGLRLSYSADLPVGATVVSVLGILPLVAVAIMFIKSMYQRISSSTG